MIFLYVFMQGILVGARIPEDAAQIIGRLWIAGVIPIFVGLGLLINGLFVRDKRHAATKTGALEREPHALTLPPTEPSEVTSSPISVIEQAVALVSPGSDCLGQLLCLLVVAVASYVTL
jgi:hypothetical protein